MSDIIFPKPAGLGWSVFKTPQLRTGVQPVASGKEVRVAYWSMPRWEFKLRWEYLKDVAASPYSDLRTLVGFFLSRLGSFDSFLYEDPDDRGVVGERFGTGDGTTKIFQLMRNFGSFVEAMRSPAGIRKNLALFPYAIDNAVWTKNQCTVSANSQTAPDGTVTADRVTPTGGATDAYCKQMLVLDVVTPVAGQPYQAGVWLRAASGTPSINISIANQGGTSRVIVPCVLSTSWQFFSCSATMDATDTGVQVFVGSQSTWPEADGAVDVWGAVVQCLAEFPLQTQAPGNAAPKVYVDGVLKAIDVDYTIDTLGVVTFVTAPANTKPLTADFGYYFRVRFKQDALELEQFLYQLWTLRTLDLLGEKR